MMGSVTFPAENTSSMALGPEAASGRPTLDGTCTLYDFLVEAVLVGGLCLFGYTGNTLSMICLARDKSKTATPFLLVSLEVADTLFLLAIFLIRVAKSVVRYTDWEAVMPVFPYIAKYVFPFALTAEMGTIYLTVLVTVNRYISVCRPYEVASLCSMSHARKHVVLVTLLCIAYNLPRFFEYQIVPMFDPYRNRTVNVVELSELGRNYVFQILYTNIMYSVVMFLVPLVCLIILNLRLISALRRTFKKRTDMLSMSHHHHHKKSSSSSAASATSSSALSRSEDDITLVLIVVVLVFVVCQTPALITQLLLVLLPTGQRACPSPFFYYERISDMLVVTNSAINFLIYCFCSRKFRQILLNLVCGAKYDIKPDISKAAAVTVKATICHSYEPEARGVGLPEEGVPVLGGGGDGVCEEGDMKWADTQESLL